MLGLIGVNLVKCDQLNCRDSVATISKSVNTSWKEHIGEDGFPWCMFLWEDCKGKGGKVIKEKCANGLFVL